MTQIRATIELEARRGLRRDVQLPATLRHNQVPIDIEIENLSSTGFRARSDAPLVIGDEVMVGFVGAGRHPAGVVRRDGDVVGFQFDTPLDPMVVAQARAQSNILSLGIEASATGESGAVERPPLSGVARSLARAVGAALIAIGEGLRRR